MNSPSSESGPFDLALFPFEIANQHYISHVALIEAKPELEESVFGHVRNAVRRTIGQARIKGINSEAIDKIEQSMIDERFKGLVDYKREFSLDVAEGRMKGSMQRLKLASRTMRDFAVLAITAEMQDTDTQEVDMNQLAKELINRQFEGFDTSELQA